MGYYLMLDIGAGTMDLLCYETEQHLCYKAVVSSPILEISRNVEQARGNLLFTGCEMGGGGLSKILKSKARDRLVVMTRSAARTIHHDFKKVRGLGISIINESEVGRYRNDGSFTEIELADIQIDRIRNILDGMRKSMTLDAVGVCAQDHGVPPSGMSHLDFRHKYFRKKLSKGDFSFSSLLHGPDNFPSTMNRLCSIEKYAKKLSTKRVYLMDSGMAAIFGASLDKMVLSKERIIVLDIATSHTIGAAINNGVLAGFFEYHTKDISLKKLISLIKALPEGKISHNQILEEGGHGAYIRNTFDYNSVQAIVATGPMRHIVEKCDLPVFFGAPWGDNMMSGTTGLMEAIRVKENLKPIKYL